jgi:hypothetical protein
MEKMLSNKAVSFTELRDPAKVLAHAGDSPVAVLNRNKVVGYFVPKTAVDQVSYEMASSDDVKKAIQDTTKQDVEVLDYLKDK